MAAAATASTAAAAAAAAAATTPAPTPAPPALAPVWSSEQDKLFEKALAGWDDKDNDPDKVPASRWEEVAAMVPGKTAAEVRAHYERLVQDITSIEAGLIVPPCYSPRDALLVKDNALSVDTNNKKLGQLSSSSTSYHHNHNHHHHHHHSAANGTSATAATLASAAALNASSSGGSSKSKAQDQERRKGIPWTEDEHRLFLLGLEKFGKGDWRSISRNFVVSRTPTQVASHAQKYFIRLNSIHKDKRRTSIHDITSVNGDGRQQALGPITGQGGGGGGAPSGTGAGTGTATAPGYSQPPAVGTPVPVVHPGAYGVAPGRGHVSSRTVPGTPLNVAHPHIAYPMPQPAMHH